MLQDQANLIKDKEAVKWQVKVADEKLVEIKRNLELAMQIAREAEAAKEVVQVALEETKRSKAAEVEGAVKEAVRQYQSSEEFIVLLEKEVGLEMVDLIYCFKRFSPGQKLNLNFAAYFPP